MSFGMFCAALFAGFITGWVARSFAEDWGDD